MAGHFIDDGYTRNGYIEPSEEAGVPELSFTYRPALPARYEWAEGVKGLEPEERVRRRVTVIAEQVSSWSGKDHKGNPVPVSAAAASRLHWLTQLTIFNIVCGLRASDDQPTAIGDQSGN